MNDTMPSAGTTLRRVGLATVITGVVGANALRVARLDADFFWVYMLPLFFIVGGAFMMYRGKQRAAAARSHTADTLLDAAAPVLYFRSFAADESSWGQIFGALLTAKMFTPVLTLEEQLAEAVAPIGPLVGVGEPGESMPKPGAVRVYPARWQERVDDLLRRARLVILRLGASEGVWWETEQTFRTANPEKVVVMLRGLKNQPYESLRSAIAERCRVELPPFRDLRRGGRTNALVEFGTDWRPHVLPLRAPYWRASVRRPMTDVFKYSLAPVFARVGATWEPSPVSAAKVASAGMVAMIAVLVLGLAGASLSGSAGRSVETPFTPIAAVETPMTPVPQFIAGLMITVRGTPKPVDLKLPTKRRADFETIEGYLCGDGAAAVMITRFIAKDGVAISVKGAAEGGLDGLATTPGVTEFHVGYLVETVVSGRRAVRTSASFAQAGEAWIGEGVTFAAGQTLWAVQAVAPRQEGADVRRVIESIAVAQRGDGQVAAVLR